MVDLFETGKTKELCKVVYRHSLNIISWDSWISQMPFRLEYLVILRIFHYINSFVECYFKSARSNRGYQL